MDIIECKQKLPIYVCDVQKVSKTKRKLLGTKFLHRQLVICTDGSARVHIHGATETYFEKGMVMFVETGARFLMRPSGKGVSFCRIAFDGAYAPEYIAYYGFHLVTAMNAPDGALQKADKVMSEFKRKNYYEASICLYELIGMLGDAVTDMRERAQTADEMVFRSFRDYIKTNIHDPNMSKADFLRRAAVTEERLDEITEKLCGKTADEHIHDYRIEYVKYSIFLMISSNSGNFYTHCGYRSAAELERDFENSTGISVKQYYDELFE